MKKNRQWENEAFFERLRTYQMVASIKEPKQLEIALSLKNNLAGVFLLTGHIGVIKGYVDLFKKHELPVFLHLEKIGGLSTDTFGLDYLAKVIRPTGIITTKTNVVKIAEKMDLLTIQRFFLVDTEGLDNISKSLCQIEPDVVEIMPARIPEMIGEIKKLTSLPIITGGLLFDRSHAVECLRYGATAVSSSKSELWNEVSSPHFA
ncbi:glycerol-3-phosphate responsive antiterminator [Paenibacillus hamazuiensis]|uniref:glycerol-3-phosphate responsive antiterminator n=1 Tax=Paenibacillus hamazuiensis TaxID=2936508 RepID=UPI00200C7ED6|nr:glycerol-3-phosphate responsive antiterminator [Paenibacillus hamazuiensis]